MLEIHSNLKELLFSLNDNPHTANFGFYQNAYLRFRGLAVNAATQNEVYQQWVQQYLTDVNDETGEIVKLHESLEDMKGDIAAFIKLIDRTEGDSFVKV